MRIMFCITGLSVGGAERQVVDLANRFAELGHEVSILVLRGKPVLLPAQKVQVILLQMSKSPFSVLKSFLAAKDIVKKYSPDVLHSHMRHANLFCRILRLFTPIRKLISTSHTSNDGGLLWMAIYKATDGLSEITTTVSHAAEKVFSEFRAADSRKLRVVYNGIDTDKFQFSMESRLTLRSSLSISPDKSVLISIGRLTEAKDYPTLLRAFQLVRQRVDAELYIVGEGPLMEPLKLLAKRFDISNHVHFLGLRADIPQLLSASDLFVLSSAWEGFGLVVAEAMACKRRVVATAADGVCEVVGDCGRLVAIGDAEALAEGVCEALAITHEQDAILGERGRLRVLENFSLNISVKRWLDIYGGNTVS